MGVAWFNKKVLILGLSRSGISVAKYLNRHGADVFVTELRVRKDEDSSIIEEMNALGIKIEMGGHSQAFIKDSVIAITSPGIPPSSEIFMKLKKEKIQIISEVELAYQESKTPFIAITGTNGKTTTTALVAHILSKEFKAQACGNIGNPTCDFLDKKNDYFVCEMSSYQISTSNTFQAQIACWLNFTPEHLDWHGGVENYFMAKSKLFTSIQKPTFAIFNGMDEKLLEFSKTISSEIFLFAKEVEDNCCYVRDDIIYFKRSKKEEKIIELKACSLIGEHNYQNIMCAVIISKLVGMTNEKIISAIESFKSPEHRLEYVRDFHGIKFYNDSKATNPEAAIVAMKSFNNKDTVLIAGGRDKNTDLTKFCQEVKKYIKMIILVGEASKRFEDSLKENDFDNIIIEKTIENAIEKAIEKNPEIVLLSPACASFDMFRNYEERGKVFKDYVLSKN